LKVLLLAGKVNRAQGTSHTVDVPMQLDVSYILYTKFAFALPVSLGILARAADKTGFLLKAINILSIRAKELLLLIKCANELVRA
jgi:hypothetical protein